MRDDDRCGRSEEVNTPELFGQRLRVRVLREFMKRFPRTRPALFKSGQWYFHLDNAPVHNSILVTDYLTKMGIKILPSPIVQTLLPVTFGYSLSSETVVMRQLRRWKWLWRRSTPPLGQDMTQGQFFNGVKQVWIQRFPSPWLVASPRLKNPVCPTIPIAVTKVIDRLTEEDVNWALQKLLERYKKCIAAGGDYFEVD